MGIEHHTENGGTMINRIPIYHRAFAIPVRFIIFPGANKSRYKPQDAIPVRFRSFAPGLSLDLPNSRKLNSPGVGSWWWCRSLKPGAISTCVHSRMCKRAGMGWIMHLDCPRSLASLDTYEKEKDSACEIRGHVTATVRCVWSFTPWLRFLEGI